MSEPDRPEADSKEFQALKEDFERAWQQALKGHPPPSAAAYVRRYEASDRALLEQELLRVQRQFQRQMAETQVQDAATLPLGDTAPALPVRQEADQTIEDVPSRQPGQEPAPADRPPAPGPAPEADPANPGMTLAYSPGDPSRPAGEVGPEFTTDFTVDYQPGESPSSPSPAPGATLDYAPPTPAGASPSLAPGQSVERGATMGPRERRRLGAVEGPRIAGYELLGELGRGAMGVVYKARQLGLNRLVALKMLLAGGYAGEHELARFQTEAEAVARLQHPNIVQVYDVGEHDGLAYFSLEYVDGGTLSKRIDRKPQPPEEAARMVSLLAQGMACAHQHNVLHRDLKPANVLLSRDGQPKITDFGLAKRLEEDSGQTKSGTLMGTPSYMAPEQARGEAKELGPAADIYALGAILYEMLTGRPPFMGASILDTLEQVRSQEPVPPTRLQPKVPRDLETICLKCLHKEPAKRYASASDLADDLERFQAGEPIRARPVGRVERLWRWCKRYPLVAGLSAAVALLLVAVAIGSAAGYLQIRAEKAEVERQKQRADAKARDEEVARKLAEGAQRVASEQRGLALDALGTLVGEVQQQMGDSPALQEVRRKLLHTAMQKLERIAKNADKNRDVQAAEVNMAIARMKLGELFKQLGDTRTAFKQFQEANEIFAAVAQAHPNSNGAKTNLAASFTTLGEMALYTQGDMTKAREYYRKALELRGYVAEHLSADDDLDPVQARRSLGEAYTRLADIVMDPAEQRDYYTKALELQKEWIAAHPGNFEANAALASLYRDLAGVCFRLGEEAASRDYYEKCLQLCEEQARQRPFSLGAQLGLGYTQERFGDFSLRSGHPDRARELYEKAVNKYAEMAQKDPRNRDFKLHTARAHYKLATALLRLGETGPAGRHYGESLKLREAEAKSDPLNVVLQKDYMLSLARCGKPARAAAVAEQVHKRAPKDAESLFKVACCYALCAAAVSQGEGGGPPGPGDRALQQRYAGQAVAVLRQALAQGFHDEVLIRTEPDLDPLRQDPAFQALMNERKTSVARAGGR